MEKTKSELWESLTSIYIKIMGEYDVPESVIEQIMDEFTQAYFPFFKKEILSFDPGLIKDIRGFNPDQAKKVSEIVDGFINRLILFFSKIIDQNLREIISLKIELINLVNQEDHQVH